MATQAPFELRVSSKVMMGLNKETSRMFHSRILTRSLLAAGATSLLAAAGPASAADLGGNCCADLEERIAELEATTARKGNRKVSLTVSGQVHTGVLYFDDGVESNVYVTDQDNTSSRFRFTGSAKINADWSAGFLIEIETQVAPSNTVTQLNDDGTTAFDLRHTAWWIQSKQFGRLTVGQTSPATDDIILSDAAGASPAAFADQLIGNSLFFRLNSGQLSNISLSTSTGGLDTSRRNIVRYDTPTFAGAKIVGSWGEDDFWDVALWYAGEARGFKIVGGVGYFQDSDFSPNGLVTSADQEEYKGSISILHEPSGIFGSFAFVHTEFTERTANPQPGDRDYYYFNGGYVAKNLTPLGKTVFYGEYATVNRGFTNLSANGAITAAGGQNFVNLSQADSEVWGFGVVQHIPAAAMEIYALYKNFDLDARDAAGAAISTEDIDIVYTGARIKF